MADEKPPPETVSPSPVPVPQGKSTDGAASVDAASVMAALSQIKTDVNAIATKKDDSFKSTVLKGIGAIILAGLTGWWSAHLVQKDAERNRLHERIGEHAADAFFETQSLVDDVYTDLEAFCLNTKQASKEPDARAAKLRRIIDGGPFPERVTSKLRTFNNYVQDQMARHAGAQLSATEQTVIRKEAHRLRDEAMSALRIWSNG